MSNSRPKSDYLRLCNAIEKRDNKTARNLIRSNVNVNVSHTRGNTPLHLAIITYDLDIMTMLLDKGANIHAKNHQNYKPFDVAIQHYNSQAALLLIKRGALVGEDLNALLLKLIEENKLRIVKILIDNELQNNPSIDWKVAFDLAISQGLPLIIEHILPHCRFLKPSDKYIPRELIVNPAAHYEECVKLLLKWDFTVNADSAHDADFVYAAVENGYLSIVLKLLKFGIDVDMVNPKIGLSLLKVACVKKHYEIVKNLLKHNACVNVKTSTNTKILKKLLRHNYNLFSWYVKKDLRDITCLHIAVLNSDSEMTKLLLRYGATIIDDQDFFKITGMAVHNNCEEIVRIFLDRGVNVDNVDSEGKSLLHFCVLPTYDGQDSKYNISKLLLDQGATIHIQTPCNSLAFEAIKNNYRKIAQLFLDYNADVQYISPDGDTLLHEAIKNHFDIKFIKSLLKLNLPVNAVNNKMLTPLLVACNPYFKNLFEFVEALLDYDANVNCADESLMTPLHFACSFKNLEVVTLLLEKGANPNAINKKGQTPLHLVCGIDDSINIYFAMINKNALCIIQLLLKHNANIEAVDEKGWTPLFEACKAGNDEEVKCLLDNHANANHTDLKKLTPIYVAVQNCSYHFRAVEILLERKVNVHCIDERGQSIVHIIVDKDKVELIKSFAHTLVNFNSVSKDGDSPLHIAVHKESVKMIKSLIKYGANVNILNKKQQTSLRIAMKKMLDYQKKYKSAQDDSEAGFYDSWAYISDLIKYKDITRSLKIHVVKLKVAGLKVNNQNFNIVYNFDDYTDDESSDEEDTDKIDILQLEMECEQEIEKMKRESIGVDNITFHDLLTRNIHFLCRFVKNKKIRQLLKSKVYDKKFPLYMDIVRSRFRDAKFRYRMMNSASKYFISNITHQLSAECIDTVFSYLKTKELNMFIRAMKRLDG